MKLLSTISVFLEIEECHAKDCLSSISLWIIEKFNRLTETNVPGKKNIVTAASVIIDELSRWESFAIAAVACEIR